MLTPFTRRKKQIYDNDGREVRQALRRGRRDPSTLMQRLLTEEIFWKLYKEFHSPYIFTNFRLQLD